jgi:hypothetical protein
VSAALPGSPTGTHVIVLADTEAANPNEISELVRIEVFFMEVEVILSLDDDFAQKWMEVNDFFGKFQKYYTFLNK